MQGESPSRASAMRQSMSVPLRFTSQICGSRETIFDLVADMPN